MKTQTDNTQEQQKETVQRVQQEPSTGGDAAIADNRPVIAVQRKLRSAMSGAEDTLNPIQLRKNNTGLPDNLKSGIENLSGYSMDDVKVHYNSSKPAQLQAHAYAQGTDIHLAPGQEKHLPHEAWHVVQQKQGRVQPTRQLKSKVNINDDAGLEKEADVMGAKALQMRKIQNSIIGSDNKTLSSKVTKLAIQRVKKKPIVGAAAAAAGLGLATIFGLPVLGALVGGAGAAMLGDHLLEEYMPDYTPPNPFRWSYFNFASEHNGIIGSLYFDDGTNCSRMRLCHAGHPYIASNKANNMLHQYFYDAAAPAPPQVVNGVLATNVVTTWMNNNQNQVSRQPIAGRNIIEYYVDPANNLNYNQRHISRGSVSFPWITPRDVSILHNLISGGLPGRQAGHINNVNLERLIRAFNLTNALRQ